MKNDRGSSYTRGEQKDTHVQRAKNLFSRFSWPGPGDELWSRTDVSGIDFESYIPTGMLPVIPGTPAEQIKLTFSSLDGLTDLPSLSRWTMAAQAELSRDKVEAFHFMRLNCGFTLDIPENTRINDPIILKYNTGPAGTHQALFGHIIAGEGSSIELAVIFDGRSQDTLLTGGLHLDLRAGSNIKITLIQDISRSSHAFFFHSADTIENARLDFSEIDLGAGISVSAPVFHTRGYNADIHITGLYAAASDQHKNLRPVQRHARPGGKSTSLYKGALLSGGHTVFQGLIRVEPGAAKTDAYLSNRNLLAADGARADSIPSLQILNNDVRCTHGSTTGKLNEEEIFYLQSRGFSREEAQRTLLWGFYEDALGGVSPAIAQNIRSRLEAHPLFSTKEPQ